MTLYSSNPSNDYDAIADLFRTLSHPDRYKIYEYLEKPHDVTQIIHYMNMDQAKVSSHLRVMREHGLVRATPTGKHRIYSRVNRVHNFFNLTRDLYTRL